MLYHKRELCFDQILDNYPVDMSILMRQEVSDYRNEIL